MFTGRFAAFVASTTLTATGLGLAALGFAGTAAASSVDDAFPTGPSSKGAKTFAVDAASACCPQYVTSA
jgi:hypothetical protein